MREALKSAERYANQPELAPAVTPPAAVNPPPSRTPEVESEMIPDVDNASVVSLGSTWQGSLKIEGAMKGTEKDLDELGDAGDEFTDGQMIFLDFGFAPTRDIDGQFTLNILGNVADLEPLEIQYGRRGFPLTVQTIEDVGEFEDVEFSRAIEGRERIEIYDFSATYRGKIVDIEAFYHTPRYHWKYEGDFFGLVREATDIDGQDIWNAKAPAGVEFAGKGALEGLKLVGGPEVYWGANPKAILKYSSEIGKLLPFTADSLFGQTEYTFMFSEDLDRQGTGASGTAATVRETRQVTLYTKTSFTNQLSLELGGIFAADDRVGFCVLRVGDQPGGMGEKALAVGDLAGLDGRVVPVGQGVVPEH